MQKHTTLANELWPLLLPRILKLGVGSGGTSTPSGSGGGGGGGGVSEHDLGGSLHKGLLRDDQGPQFLLASGTRALTGNLAVSAGVTIDGVDLSAHAADPDAHHARQHGILSSSDHTVTGSAWQIVGLGSTDTLGLLTPSSNVTGATKEALLKSDGSGYLSLVRAIASDRLRAPLIDTASGNLTIQPAVDLLLAPSSNLVKLLNGKAVRSESFTSGFAGAGFQIDQGIISSGRTSAEFDDLTVRGRMRVYELLIQQIRATNGSLFVTSGSKVVTVTAVSNAWTVNGSPLTFNGSPATFSASFYTISTAAPGDSSRSLYHGFLYGDLPVAQQVQWDGTQFAGITQSKLEVTRVDSLTQYGAVLVEGDAPAAGYDYVRRGNTVDPSRRGAIYLTSDDSAAPFIDIIDGLRYHSDWGSASLQRTRLGKLSGISDVAFGGALEGYGLYSENVYLKGKIVVTGGSLGGLAAADVNANTTTIDGGRITTGTVTANQIAAATITAQQIAANAITGDNLDLTSYIAVASPTFGALGIQLQYNNGTPRAYIGDGSDSFLSFDGQHARVSGAIIEGATYVTGSVYAGDGNVRISTDGQRLKLNDTSGPNVPTNTAAVRWSASITDVWDNSGLYNDNYVGFVAYRHTAYSAVDLLLTSYVGDTNDADYDARVILQAGHNRGGTYEDANLVIARNRGTTGSQITATADTFYVSSVCSAASYVDRTPAYDGDALADLRGVRGVRGEIDHSSLPAAARRRVRRPDGAQEAGRDLGAMISILTKAVQQIDARLSALERGR